MPSQLPALVDGQSWRAVARSTPIERRASWYFGVESFGNVSHAPPAFATQRIPSRDRAVYAQAVDEFAQNSAYLHEVSGGRFQFGIGIAHAPAYARFEVKPGKPLGDTRAFVEKFKAHTEYGKLPPVILATLRKRMIALSAEIGDGLIFASGSRAYMPDSLSALPPTRRRDPDFFIGNRVRTCFRTTSRRLSDAAPLDGELLAHAELPQLLEGDRLRRNGDTERWCRGTLGGDAALPDRPLAEIARCWPGRGCGGSRCGRRGHHADRCRSRPTAAETGLKRVHAFRILRATPQRRRPSPPPPS